MSRTPASNHYILDEADWRGVNGWPIRRSQTQRDAILPGNAGCQAHVEAFAKGMEKGTREREDNRRKWVVHPPLIRAIRPQRPLQLRLSDSAAPREVHLPLLPSGPDGVRKHQSRGD